VLQGTGCERAGSFRCGLSGGCLRYLCTVMTVLPFSSLLQGVELRLTRSSRLHHWLCSSLRSPSLSGRTSCPIPHLRVVPYVTIATIAVLGLGVTSYELPRTPPWRSSQNITTGPHGQTPLRRREWGAARDRGGPGPLGVASKNASDLLPRGEAYLLPGFSGGATDTRGCHVYPSRMFFCYRSVWWPLRCMYGRSWPFMAADE
jgi:hypothetical protein